MPTAPCPSPFHPSNPPDPPFRRNPNCGCILIETIKLLPTESPLSADDSALKLSATEVLPHGARVQPQHCSGLFERQEVLSNRCRFGILMLHSITQRTCVPGSSRLALLAPRRINHWRRVFLNLQATHSPADHTTDGFITPHVEQSHTPNPTQCQQVTLAICASAAVKFGGSFRKTSKRAGFASRTRFNKVSSKARLGLRQRMSPSTVTLTPRQRSSVKSSAAWFIGGPCRRRARCLKPPSKFVNLREPECAHSFQ